MENSSKAMVIAPGKEVLTATREIEGLSRLLFAIGLLAGGILSLGLAFVIGADPNVRGSSVQSWKLALLVQLLIAVGTSIFSSMLFYLFYSSFLEKRVLRDVTANAAEVAATYANNLYLARFDRMMPSKVYPETTHPMPEFQRQFDEVLKSSRIYRFKGDAGGFTTFRLHQLCEKGHLLEKEIVLLILDPRDHTLLRERAKIELAVSNPTFSKQDLEDHIASMRKSIFATLVAVFDISHKTRVKVGFHKEHLFFRSEIFDDGIFLTFYLGGEFPSTAYYPRTTFTYQAYLENFRQIRKSADPELAFSTQMTDDHLRARLTDLGCDIEIEELRNFKDSLFHAYGDMMEGKNRTDSFQGNK
jgi:hypothetical protein